MTSVVRWVEVHRLAVAPNTISASGRQRELRHEGDN